MAKQQLPLPLPPAPAPAPAPGAGGIVIDPGVLLEAGLAHPPAAQRFKLLVWEAIEEREEARERAAAPVEAVTGAEAYRRLKVSERTFYRRVKQIPEAVRDGLRTPDGRWKWEPLEAAWQQHCGRARR